MWVEAHCLLGGEGAAPQDDMSAAVAAVLGDWVSCQLCIRAAGSRSHHLGDETYHHACCVYCVSEVCILLRMCALCSVCAGCKGTHFASRSPLTACNCLCPPDATSMPQHSMCVGRMLLLTSCSTTTSFAAVVPLEQLVIHVWSIYARDGSSHH